MSQYLEMTGKEDAEQGRAAASAEGVARAGGLLGVDGRAAPPMRASAIKQRVALVCYGLVFVVATAVCAAVYVNPASSVRQCMQQPLVQQAVAALESNWRERNTIPSPKLYPHQWSWDSAFIAIGYSWYNQQRAQTELTSLFEAQWANGMLPHIVFNPAIPSGSYWPGPEFWNCSNAAPSLAPHNVQTSGIVQPPVHATAAWLTLQRATDKAAAVAWLRELYPKLVAWMDFLYRERDADGDGLVYIRHPWESGMDNSPNWDAALQRIVVHPGDIPAYQRADTHRPGVNPADRPTDWTYDRFVYLVEMAKKLNYNEFRIREVSPFLIDDVLFNSILARANLDMISIATQLDQFSDVVRFRKRYDRTVLSMNTKMWDGDSGMYYDYDEVTQALIKEPVGGNLAAVFSGAPALGQAGQARATLDRLGSSSFCGVAAECTPLPSYAVTATNFSTHNYWRGPVWINVNWLVYNGLATMDSATALATRMKSAILTIVDTKGFWEYFDPYTLQPHGTDGFSWTASLYIDLVCSDGNPQLASSQ